MKALKQLDPVLEHRVRLAVCVLLAQHEKISFSRFKEQLEVTDGNLGAQLRRLEECGYIGLDRDFVERRPVTWYHLTSDGSRALQRHLEAMRQLISAAD
ncbi:transcriptional regulator [Microbulbifer sp. TYP-18]|uniref:transcriptional regulator n=1 Tax=Microbulbifer sp. TYP-18 TaxID=3230024 RepID=UPI0034C68EA1